MMNEEDYLMISGIQHFDFCRRQWALIHIEQQWQENILTVEGKIEHTVCHDESRIEKRSDLIIMRGTRVVSHKLQLTGVCDVVEFHSSDDGVELNRYSGKWMPVPIEYKHGHSKTIDADRLQLCAQAMALEEMMVCDIPRGYLFYKETNKREKVELTSDLRKKVEELSREMHYYFLNGHTPRAKEKAKCNRCSLKDICLPTLSIGESVSLYIYSHIKEK
ncbi:MAG: CRISPR-associated protein Cas4 [Lachnospiraceae bacterium]|nr:CRISPR-associated protein Cas4 [Lachnospiraceae bacterium]